jgi:hypothetical protein
MSTDKEVTEELQHGGFGHGVHQVPPDYHRPSIDSPSRETFPGGAEIDSRDLDRAATPSHKS